MNNALLKLLILFIFSSCGNDTQNKPLNKTDSEDSFYTSNGDFGDYIRCPLIKPYEFKKAHGAADWKIELYSYEIDLIINNVLDVNVVNQLILVHSGATYFRDIKKAEAWFVINPLKKTEKGFDNIDEFLKYLASQNIHNFKLINADTVYNEFKKNRKINWDSELK